jgi:hypothetical protein
MPHYLVPPDVAHGAIVGTLAGAAPPWFESHIRLIPPSQWDLERYPSFADASEFLRPHPLRRQLPFKPV